VSQKELQRVAVIAACLKGEVACARAAELLCLSVRQIKRLRKRMREDGEAALAHASRGRPSPRRLPVRMQDRILHLARTRYVGFNDHHLCEKVGEGISLGRETLRRLFRQNGLGSPKKRRAPTHRQRRPCRAREGEMLLLPWARLEVPGGPQGRERKYTNDRAAVKSSVKMHFPK
jgi:transposase